MRGFIIIACFVLGATACKKESEKFELESSSTTFVYGDYDYQDVLTSALIEDVPAAVSEVILTDGNVYPAWVKTESTGDSFVMGPFKAGTNTVHGSFTDEVTGITYKKSTAFTLIDTTINLSTIRLEPEFDYTFLCTVTDSLGNPVQGAAVFLYTNYGFLSDYRGNASAAIRTATSNSQGRVLFHHLTNVPHYLYAEKFITIGEESDTLHSFDPDFDPTTAPVLNQHILNVNSIQIKQW